MLERIQKANDIKELNYDEMEVLAGEIRELDVYKRQAQRMPLMRRHRRYLFRSREMYMRRIWKDIWQMCCPRWRE